MAFSGFPGRAADYIQASSRVGRKHVGIVFQVYNPAYNIDRSAYVHFRSITNGCTNWSSRYR